MKIYKYYDGKLTVAEARKTAKMYIVDKIFRDKPGYIGFYESQRLYEIDVFFTPNEAFQAERNRLNTSIGLRADALRIAISKLEILDDFEDNYIMQD